MSNDTRIPVHLTREEARRILTMVERNSASLGQHIMQALRKGMNAERLSEEISKDLDIKRAFVDAFGENP